jgi:ribonuclease HI
MLADERVFVAYGPYWRADAARLTMDRSRSIQVWQRRETVFAAGGDAVARAVESPADSPALRVEEGIAMEYAVVIDGACLGNPGPGGWCAAIDPGCGDPVQTSGSEPQTTNNRMELRAALAGIARLPDGATATVVTDSQYVVGVLSRGWRRRTNHDLLARIDAECARRCVRFRWVPDLAGDPAWRGVHDEACARAAQARSHSEDRGQDTVTITLSPGQLALVQDLAREWAAAVMADPSSEDDLRCAERLLDALRIDA